MFKYSVAPDGERWDDLRSALRAMTTMLDGSDLNLLEFARLYQSATQSVVSACKVAGLSSLRFEAAAKAMDLETKKSTLEDFLMW